MSQVTQLQPWGVPGRPYGSFSGKSQAHPRVTQMMPTALPGPLYGSFSGKTPATGSQVETLHRSRRHKIFQLT